MMKSIVSIVIFALIYTIIMVVSDKNIVISLIGACIGSAITSYVVLKIHSSE